MQGERCYEYVLYCHLRVLVNIIVELDGAADCIPPGCSCARLNGRGHIACFKDN